VEIVLVEVEIVFVVTVWEELEASA
jgi:hypothetical protein